MDLYLQGISNLQQEGDCHFSSTISSSPSSSTSGKKNVGFITDKSIAFLLMQGVS